MAVWVLCRAKDVLDVLPEIRRAELAAQLHLSAEGTAHSEDSRKMYVPFHGDGIISQFEGYDRLAELDWDDYRRRYGNIQRLELILEAENDSAIRSKVSKQADVLRCFYLFSADELRALFDRFGYPFEHETIPRPCRTLAPSPPFPCPEATLKRFPEFTTSGIGLMSTRPL